MSDSQYATRRSKRRLSPIWIVPFVAVLMGVWMLYESISSIGPEITLEMDNAEGIEAGKTLIKTRNVEVGRVESVRLSDDLSRTLITARMNPDTEHMLNEDSRFWVVKPRIGREGISGLGTVLSGAYIQLLPGRNDTPKNTFTVLEQPPVAPLDAPGLRINLSSQSGNALRIGDPVNYQGFTVGRIETAEFDADTKEMHYQLYIQSPYAMLVTNNTRFWTTSGLDVRIDSQGFRVNVGSFESLLGGGITFGVPNGSEMGHPVTADAHFQLFADEESAHQGIYDRYIEYALLLNDTVRGLSPGAPVEYRGIRIGTVISVPWHFTSSQPDTLSRFAIPVLIRIEPQRIYTDTDDTFTLDEWKDRLNDMFERGLRASLKSGNLLTGALFVDLSFQQDADPYLPMSFENKPVLPSTSASLAQIEQKVSDLLDKLNHLNVEPIIASLDNTLASIQQTMESFNSVAQAVEQLVNAPGTQAMPETMNNTLQQLQKTLDGFAPEAQSYQDLNQTLQQLELLLRELRPVARTLNEQPNALLFNKKETTDPQPKAIRQ